jgi:hypothetical protein
MLNWARTKDNAWGFDGESLAFTGGLPVVMQAPAGVQIPIGMTMHTWYAPRTAVDPAAPTALTTTMKTIVPDLIGYPAAQLHTDGRISDFELLLATDDPLTPGARVISQDVPPGEIVPVNAPVRLRYASTDPKQTTFGAFPATHPALADVRVNDVLAAMSQDKAFLAAALAGSLAPWPVARAYVSAQDLDDVLARFATFKAGIVDPSRDLEAVWRSFNLATFWTQPA